MNILYWPGGGENAAEVIMTSLTLSMPVFDAASSSATYKDLEPAISRQEGHSPQGSVVGALTQLSDFARMRAVVVFPTPRAPANRYAWCRLLDFMALPRVRVMASCPTTWPNVFGRNLSAMTCDSDIHRLFSREFKRENWSGSGLPAAHPRTCYRCSVPGLAGFAAARLHGFRSLSNVLCLRGGQSVFLWRRGWDSNPRYGFPYTAFPVLPVQPLLHLSKAKGLSPEFLQIP